MKNEKTTLIILSLIAVLILGWCRFYEEPAKKEIKILPADIGEKVIIQGNSFMAIPHEELAKIEFWAVVTAYSPVEGCDDPDCIMANGQRVFKGAVANNQYPLGTKIKIDGEVYVLADRMAESLSDRWDIFMEDYWEARNWGKQIKKIEIL